MSLSLVMARKLFPSEVTTWNVLYKWHGCSSEDTIEVSRLYTTNIFEEKWHSSYSGIRAEVPLQAEYNFCLLDMVRRSLADKSAEIKPKFFWYRDTSRRERKVHDKGVCRSWNASSPLSQTTERTVLASGILISSEELASSFIQTFISWRICYGQVAVSQIVILCFVPTYVLCSSRSISPSKELERPKENIIVSHSLLLRNLVITLQMEHRGCYHSIRAQLRFMQWLRKRYHLSILTV